MITFSAADESVLVFRDGEQVATIEPFMEDGIAIERLVPCAISGPTIDPHGRYVNQPITIQFSEMPNKKAADR